MMPSEQDRAVLEQENRIKVQVDDYQETVSAILGFARLWVVDPATRQNRQDAKSFQGRRLTPVAGGTSVTPDLGIVVRDEYGMLAEVNKNFPGGNDERSRKVLTQLKSYDRELSGWPTPSRLVNSHELVLLVHQTTARWAADSYRTQSEQGNLIFDRNVSIVQFNRLPMAKEHLFFQEVLGEVRLLRDSIDLYHGCRVPMLALVGLWSQTKLYDAEPPMPYLPYLIWQHVITPRAAETENFSRLRRNSKMDVTVKFDDIVDELARGFSFWSWHVDDKDYQPNVPKKGWVKAACEFLVRSNEARWADEGSELVVFYRKYSDPLRHFVHLHAEAMTETHLQPLLPGFDQANGAKPRK
ncbi:MAG: hypothetical protein NTU41_06945 [Chloroflexi bacterium]|nr:hypothetical protein [Chloroflexota bacterium]